MSIGGISGVSGGIGGVGMADHPGAASATSGADKTDKKDDAKLHQMAKEFEAMFVRQILTAAKVGAPASGKSDAYSGMGVDALANGITSGTGLGLAREIEETVRRADHHSSASAGAPGGPTGVSTASGAPSEAPSTTSLSVVSAASGTTSK